MSGAAGESQALRLTAQQAAPLAISGASVALSAGAGCGKTTVLTERFLRALESSGTRPLRKLVALTFTQKAARELRQRIRAECYRRLAVAEGDGVGHWRAVLRGLEAAPIGTFHEYCGRLLRRHALEAGLDPDFEVLDEPITESIRDEALNRCLRRWLETSQEEFVEVAARYGLGPARDILGRLIRVNDVSGLRRWVEKTDDEILAIWREAWESEGLPALAEPVRRAAEACLGWNRRHPLDHPRLVQFQAVLMEMLPEVLEREPGEWLLGVREAALLPRGLRANHWPSPEIHQSGKDVHKALRDALDGFLDQSRESEATTRECLAIGRRFTRLAVEARSEFDAAKQARGGLDFDDLLLKTRDLMRTHADLIREHPAEPVEFVLVDEFQDTDPVQSEILALLGGGQYESVPMFVVGDPKQSIYRFRGAQPEIFQILRAAFPEECRLDLTENFRSAPGVIDFVNALFAEAFRGETPRLLPGPFAMAASRRPAVEFVWANDPQPETEEAAKVRVSSDEQRRVEARWLARLIRERLELGWPIIDRRTRQVRDAHAGDVAFLFRAMTDLAAYEQALDTEGLDYHVVGGKAFYAQQEIQDVVNVLSVIEDPLDGVALAGALRGPFFGLTDEGLFWLGATERNGLALRFASDELIPELSDDDRLALDRARGLIRRWQAMKDRASIAEVVERVLEESGFEAALLAERLGDRKRANARKLVRLARQYEPRTGFTLGHFVARLREDLRTPPREEQAATTDEEGRSVRLLSIHQSKGLEFPIVVVPDLNRRSGPPRGGVLIHERLGPLVRPTSAEPGGLGEDAGEWLAREEESGRSLGWMTYEAIERQAEDAEAIRLFYVATTRARDALILSAGAEASARPASSAMRLLDARFDRETGILKGEIPDDWTVPNVEVVSFLDTTREPRGRTPRASLTAMSDAILTAKPAEPGSGDRPPNATPRFVDLDTIRGLNARGRRLDRLVRTILADPRLIFPHALDVIAAIAARKQSPLAPESLVREAVALLRPWLVDPGVARVISQGEREVDLAWTTTWPPESQRGFVPTVFQGRTEFFIDAPDLGWCAVIVNLPGAALEVDRLRAQLSATAAETLGIGPVRRVFLARLDPRDGAIEEVDVRRAATTDGVRRLLRELSER